MEKENIKKRARAHLGLRNEKLRKKLNDRRIRTCDLSSHTKYQLFNLSDLKSLK